jgi:hypothetical protein
MVQALSTFVTWLNSSVSSTSILHYPFSCIIVISIIILFRSWSCWLLHAVKLNPYNVEACHLRKQHQVPIMSRHESRVSSKVVNTVPEAVTVCSVNTSVLFQAYR